MASLLVLAAPAMATDTVLLFDNGEFNLPLYTPRYNGQFQQPSIAQQVASDVARVVGNNPAVYSYLPPGREAGNGREPHKVVPRQPVCEGPAEAPSDPCYCPPGDKCWTDLGVNFHPASSTSLYMGASGLRRTLGDGARIEIHFTDLFEEDPSAAMESANSDKCVTIDGTRRAVEAILRDGDTPADHVSVGVLRRSVSMPPPGGSHGTVYRQVDVGEGCWSAERAGAMQYGRPPLDYAMGVVVLGFGTAADHPNVGPLIASLGRQVEGLELVSVREPAMREALPGAQATASELAAWTLKASAPQLQACEAATATVTASLNGDAIQASGSAQCDGSVQVSVPEASLQQAFLDWAGANPLRTHATLRGEVMAEGDVAAVRGALVGLGERAAADGRGLTLWQAVPAAMDGAAAIQPWRRSVVFDSVRVAGLDRRSWLLALVVGLACSVLMALAVYRIAHRVQSEVAFRRHMSAGGADGLTQRPIAAILADAQNEVETTYRARLIGAFASGIAFGVVASWAVLFFQRTWL